MMGTFAKTLRKIAGTKSMGVQIVGEEENRKTQRDMATSGWEKIWRKQRKHDKNLRNLQQREKTEKPS